MKTADFIVKYLVKQNITDIFGYPGGMVTHLMDSLSKFRDSISTHITYHEQGAAFAACGYAQACGKTGVAFATSGPGATNLLTGIANAYFDSIPTVFITGQVNTFESKGDAKIRQKGFQETDIVSMAKPVTKMAIYISDARDIKSILDEAFEIANTGRKGPVLIDIPMDVFRTEINEEELDADSYITEAIYNKQKKYVYDESASIEVGKTEKDSMIDMLRGLLAKSRRPCILVGNGIKQTNQVEEFRKLLNRCDIPIVSSMLAVDVVPNIPKLGERYFGFIGAYGDRVANFVVAKADLLICIGSRLDIRQVGGMRDMFAPNATIVRFDIDEAEFTNVIRQDDEIQIRLDIKDIIEILNLIFDRAFDYTKWLDICREISNKLSNEDVKLPNRYIDALSSIAPNECSIVADVGQNMVWVAQSFEFTQDQRLYMSGGHGSMGYALPAAMGIYFATKKPVICISGDGGIQMNIQELQMIVREKMPITIVVMNNQSLGMIRHFQQMYFDRNYQYTVHDNGYTVPDFCKIANAYGIDSCRICDLEDMKNMQISSLMPYLYEIMLNDDTIVSPKLEYGKPNQDQEPLIDRALYDYLMGL